MKKRKLNEAEYNLSITDLNTTDGDILSQIVSMANQADNGGMGDVPATPIEDPYASDMGTDVSMDSGIGGDEFGDAELAPEEPVDDEFPSVEEDPTIDDMGYGVPVDEPSDDFMGDEDVEENNFNEEEPYTHPMLHQDSGNLLTEDEGKKGYSVMVKDKEYAHIDTENEYSDDEIINQFLKQYMAKTGKEFPYIDQIVVKRNGDVEEDVLLPKDGSENEFIPESEENWIMEDDDEGEMTEDQLNEEIDSILWSAGVKGCSDKEEKGVNTKSLMEDDEIVDESGKDSKRYFYGIKPIQFIYHGDWSDPELRYKGHSMNYWDFENALYEIFKEEGGDVNDETAFEKWVKDNAELVKSEADDFISLGESENPEMNMEDCDAPNPAEMNLDEAKNDENDYQGIELFYVLDEEGEQLFPAYDKKEYVERKLNAYSKGHVGRFYDIDISGYKIESEYYYYNTSKNEIKTMEDTVKKNGDILVYYNRYDSSINNTHKIYVNPMQYSEMNGYIVDSHNYDNKYYVFLNNKNKNPQNKEMNLDEAKGQKMMFYVIDANGDLVEGGFETRADARNYIQYVYNGTLGYPKQDVTGWRIKSEPAAPKADDPDFGLLESYRNNKRKINEMRLPSGNIIINTKYGSYRIAGGNYEGEKNIKKFAKYLEKNPDEIRTGVITLSADKFGGRYSENYPSFVIYDDADRFDEAYSPKLKDPNRKAPTRANYQDVNVNDAGKDASLGFEYPAPTGGKITLSPKAGKIMETAKHLMSKANGDKKDKLLSRYTFKLMNEGVSFSNAKRILSKF